MQSVGAQVLNGGELIARALAEEGLEYFFNLPGNGVYKLIDPLLDQPIEYRLGLHEFSVVAMADGYARATGRVPFVNLYMVPGTANAMAAIYCAYRDRSPVVVTATQQLTSTIGREPYASGPDLVGMTRQFTKWAWEVNKPERLPEAIHRAFEIAATPPVGPVFLALPFDHFGTPVDQPLTEPSRPTAVPRVGGPPPSVISQMADLLLGAQRPLFLCGKGVKECDAVAEVEALAQELGAAVVSDGHIGVVAFPTQHPLGLGEFTPRVFETFRPDVVFGIGSRMVVEASGRAPTAPEGARILTLSVDPADSGRTYRVDVAGSGDVKLGLQALLAAIRGRVDQPARSERLALIAGLQAEREGRRSEQRRLHADDRPISMPRFFQELDRVIDADTVVVEHATTNATLLFEDLNLRNPMNVFGTGGSTQGWGLPASIGVQMGRPDQRVLAVLGDGGFTFSVQALWSAQKYNVPVTVIVLNNHGYRSMRGSVLRNSPRAAARGVDFGFEFEVDVCGVARSFGVPARRIDDPADLADAVRSALQHDGPDVLEVVVNSTPVAG
jgi:benzoylformate decarboxylase